MSITDYSVPDAGAEYTAAGKVPKAARPLHRLHKVRRLQGISRRTIARRLKTDVSQIKSQEKETADILLSTLYQWQDVLQVPVEELLVEAGDELSLPIMKRAQMVRLMKTALAILERAQQSTIQRMAQTLVDQLIELMPELEEVGPWHAVGKRRTQDELGQAAYRRLSRDALADLLRDQS
jgi:transcriptional regulator with XRE-family HTH domain